MNKSEVLKALTLIKVSYPYAYKDLTKADADALVALWCRQFESYPYRLVEASIDALVSSNTSNYAPNIAQIKQKAYEITNPQEIDEMTAWSLIDKELSKGYSCVEKWNHLPKNIQSMVTPELLQTWARTDENEVNTVIQSNFMRAYRNRIAKEKEYDVLPNQVKKMIESFNTKLIEME